MRVVEVKVLKKEGSELIIEVLGEDHTLGNLIAKEALLDPRVEYSSYRIPHPLQDRMEITLVAKQGEDPLKILVDVIDRLVEEIKVFKSLIEEKV